MSLEFDTSLEIPAASPPSHNVKVLITGLALCRFDRTASTFRFLRHVPHHELTMTITQISIQNPAVQKSLIVKIEKDQDIEILATTMKPVDQADFSIPAELLSLKRIHGKPIEDKRKQPAERPTLLKLNHCTFDSAESTKDSFLFENSDGDVQVEAAQYCHVLRGYLSYEGDLQITANNGLPLTFPLSGFTYAITFKNSCDSTPGCADEEDFKFYYDVVREQGNSDKRYRMAKHSSPQKAINTGACLPVCENCS